MFCWRRFDVKRFPSIFSHSFTRAFTRFRTSRAQKIMACTPPVRPCASNATEQMTRSGWKNQNYSWLQFKTYPLTLSWYSELIIWLVGLVVHEDQLFLLQFMVCLSLACYLGVTAKGNFVLFPIKIFQTRTPSFYKLLETPRHLLDTGRHGTGH